MQQLRNRLQAKADKIKQHSAISNVVYGRYNELLEIISIINTELLAIEKQTLIDAFDYGFSSGYDDAQGDGAEFEDGQAYFNQTFNPK